MPLPSQSNKIRSLPPYLFAELDRKRRAVIAKGADVISLGIGDPDLPTPAHIVSAMQQAVTNPAYHTYPSYNGSTEYRQAAAAFVKKRFGVELEPEREILGLIGSKEGLANLPFAWIDAGDIALVPEPGYTVYASSTRFAGGTAVEMPLVEQNRYLPDLEAIAPDIRQRAKLIYINYPNNPTATIAPRSFLEKVVAFAEAHSLLIVSDNAYSEIYYDDQQRPMSILQIPGAKARSIELHSLSKTYNMTGWRVAFAIGSAEAIGALGKIKTNWDSGIFGAIQSAAVTALTGPQDCVAQSRQIYRQRRDILVSALTRMGLSFTIPEAAFYVWVKVPGGQPSINFCTSVLEKAHVVITPGIGFGKSGEGYFRMTLTVNTERLKEACERSRGIL